MFQKSINFPDVCRIGSSLGPNAARVPRVWDLCLSIKEEQTTELGNWIRRRHLKNFTFHSAKKVSQSRTQSYQWNWILKKTTFPGLKFLKKFFEKDSITKLVLNSRKKCFFNLVQGWTTIFARGPHKTFVCVSRASQKL